jgi:hypothetical protein
MRFSLVFIWNVSELLHYKLPTKVEFLSSTYILRVKYEWLYICLIFRLAIISSLNIYGLFMAKAVEIYVLTSARKVYVLYLVWVRWMQQIIHEYMLLKLYMFSLIIIEIVIIMHFCQICLLTLYTYCIRMISTYCCYIHKYIYLQWKIIIPLNCYCFIAAFFGMFVNSGVFVEHHSLLGVHQHGCNNGIAE